LLQGEKKRLLRFSPELLLPDGNYLAQKYMQLPIKDFLVLLKAMTGLGIKSYIIGTKEKIVDFLLKDKASLTLDNPQSFVYEKEQLAFDQGEITVDRKALRAFITYQLDEGALQGIFERQEYVLRLLRNELLSEKRLTAIPRKFNRLKRSIETNMGLSELLKFFNAYRERGTARTQRLTVPDWRVGREATDPSNWLDQIKQFLA
jgi:anionic cell wall polymer biosynthesis LytR-Cps2A-Psr (LCP) family protein